MRTLGFVLGGALLVLLFLAFVWSYEELNAPAEISLFRWVITLSVGYLIAYRMKQLHDEGAI